MSVILRRNNRIILYCKGADNVIYDRLNSNQLDIKTRTQEHLNVSSPNLHIFPHLCEIRINEILISLPNRNLLVKDCEHLPLPNGISMKSSSMNGESVNKKQPHRWTAVKIVWGKFMRK